MNKYTLPLMNIHAAKLIAHKEGLVATLFIIYEYHQLISLLSSC